jgi:EmrB/QacA subfamily drug resistance transporter
METIAQPISSNKSGALRARGIALIVASAMFMQTLDGTVVTTALPAMAKSFDTQATYMSIVLTSYLLSLTVFIPASGQIADRLGARNVFRTAILIFTLASVFCAASASLNEMVLARVIQGIGGAMMLPVGRLILLRSVEKTERIGAMAWLLVPGQLGPVVGPLLGGFIATYTSWRWIFAINIPIGILGIALVTLFIKDVGERVTHKFDLRGLVLSGITLCCFVCALQMTTSRGNSLTLTFLTVLAGVIFGWLYYIHSNRHHYPVVDLRLMRIPTFLTAVIGGTLFRISLGALPFLLPLMLQLGFGMSAAKSGLITFASAASAMAMKGATVSLLRRFGYRNILIWNGMFCTFFILGCAAFRPSWPLVSIYAVLIIGGLFRSLQYNAYGSIAYADIEQPRMSAATSFYSTVQQLSGALGVAISAALLTGTLLISGHSRPQLHDFTLAFIGIAIISLPPLWLSRRLHPTAGSELTGRAK